MPRPAGKRRTDLRTGEGTPELLPLKWTVRRNAPLAPSRLGASDGVIVAITLACAVGVGNDEKVKQASANVATGSAKRRIVCDRLVMV